MAESPGDDRRGWFYSIFSGRRTRSALKNRLTDLFQDLTGQCRRLEVEKNDLLSERIADPSSALENLERVRRIHSEMERIESSRNFLQVLIEERSLSRTRLLEERQKLKAQLTELEAQSRQMIEKYRALSRSPVRNDFQTRMRMAGQRISSLRDQDHLLRELLETDQAA